MDLEAQKRAQLAQLEEGLLGLTQRNLESLTDEELRERVVEIRALRTSSQTFRAAMAREVSQTKEAKVQKAKLPSAQEVKMLDDYLNL